MHDRHPHDRASLIRSLFSLFPGKQYTEWRIAAALENEPSGSLKSQGIHILPKATCVSSYILAGVCADDVVLTNDLLKGQRCCAAVTIFYFISYYYFPGNNTYEPILNKVHQVADIFKFNDLQMNWRSFFAHSDAHIFTGKPM